MFVCLYFIPEMRFSPPLEPPILPHPQHSGVKVFLFQKEIYKFITPMVSSAEIIDLKEFGTYSVDRQ